MLIEFGTEWALNQSDEFKVIKSLTIPKSKTKVEQCWYFVPCITIKKNEDTYAFNRKLVQHGAKIKWETRRMGWC
jgi:Pyruvate/2-oxoacid:ferredoxin oxidoreductase delta subunit